MKKSLKAWGSFIRYVWALPVSCFGIVLIPFVILSGGTFRIVSGVIEAEGGMIPFLLSRLCPRFGIAAMTIGHVIIGRDQESLMRCRQHELIHVRQYERWGLLFPLLYLLSSGAALVRGKDLYRNNRFEEEAFHASGPEVSAQRGKRRSLTDFPS